MGFGAREGCAGLALAYRAGGQGRVASAAIQALTQSGKAGLSTGTPAALAISDGGTIPAFDTMADRISACEVQCAPLHIDCSM